MTPQTGTAKSTGDTIFTGAFSTYSINDISAAKNFYGEILGLEILEKSEGLSLTVPGSDTNLFLYPKDDHLPATFTVFNFLVNDIEQAVEELKSRRVPFLIYSKPIQTDEKGIFWGKEQGNGPNIAWFTDPALNILSVTEA